MSAETTSPPSLTGPIASTVAASFSLVGALFTAMGSPPFVPSLVIFFAVPAVIVGSAYQWIGYVHKYVDYKVSNNCRSERGLE